MRLRPTVSDRVIALLAAALLCAPAAAWAASTEPVIWTDQRNVSVSGPSGTNLTKTGTVAGWNAGAMSSKAIAGADGYVEFSVDQTNTARTVGLSHRDRAERVLWRNLVNVGLSGDLIKTGATAWGNAGASSVQTIASGDGFVELSGAPGSTRVAGLSVQDGSTGYAEIRYGLWLAADGTLSVIESGTTLASVGTYVAADRLRVAVESGVVRYRKNGTLLHTSAVSPAYPLRADASLNEAGATLSDVSISAAGVTADVVWQNAVNVNVGGDLTKLSANAWDGGASSVQAIPSGDGFVEFASRPGFYRLCGLSRVDASQSYAEIQYALYPSYNGTLWVFESGVGTEVGTYRAFVSGRLHDPLLGS